MLIGRLPSGKIVVAYESVEEIITERSCYACTSYHEFIPCSFYANCRAEKKPGKAPVLFSFGGKERIQQFMQLDTGRKHGLKRMRVHR